MTKKYRLLKDVLNATTGHIVPLGEIFKQYKDTRMYISSNGWQMSEAAILNKDWFEEVGEKNVYVDLPSGAAQFLTIWGQSFKDGESEYYNLPMWYKFTKGNTAIQYTPKEFDNLPSRKEWLAMQGEQQKKYEILNWRIFNGELHTKKTVAPCKIHSVLRLSDNTIWSVGEETQFGIINEIEEQKNASLVFYVGVNNYPLFIYEAKKK